MKLVVAVSGGVDSVVLLHKLVTAGEHDLIVAHFDHGIREDSREDAAFVEGLARQYNVPFETTREELGAHAGEEQARTRRYAFLRHIAERYQATIATAHHADDIVETIAINLMRGTGWRGLAVLDSDIYRPLLSLHKTELVRYAREHGLAWHEDSTNASDAYLRNRVRAELAAYSDDAKRQVLALWATQCALKKDIEHELHILKADRAQQSRYFVSQLPEAVVVEYLRSLTHGLLTRPQLVRLLLAVKTMPTGKMYQAGGKVEIHFTTRHFTVKMIK